VRFLPRKLLWVRDAGLALCLLLPIACQPSRHQVASDVAASVSKEFGVDAEPLIRYIGPGEGGAGDVYMDVRLSLVPRATVTFTRGCLGNMTLTAGTPSPALEAVLLYVRRGGGRGWELQSMHWSCIEEGSSPVSSKQAP